MVRITSDGKVSTCIMYYRRLNNSIDGDTPTELR